jgi:hypothetical protein
MSPADDVRDFRAAVASGELVVRGTIVLDESLGLWKEDRAAAQRRLNIFRELAGFDRLLKQPSDLLECPIQVYAAGASMPSPLPPRRERLQLAASLERVAAGDVKLDRIVDEILAGVRARKESVRRGRTPAVRRASPSRSPSIDRINCAQCGSRAFRMLRARLGRRLCGADRRHLTRIPGHRGLRAPATFIRPPQSATPPGRAPAT